jgi:DNA-binding CsgD family transcriptional regulator
MRLVRAGGFRAPAPRLRERARSFTQREEHPMTLSSELRRCDFVHYAPFEPGLKPRDDAADAVPVDLIAILDAAFALDPPPGLTRGTASPRLDKRQSALMRQYHLSPRRLEALRWLLLGDSEKQVALRMRITHFTAHDHIRAIYRIIGVNSRSELMAVFLKAAIDSHRSHGKDERPPDRAR